MIFFAKMFLAALIGVCIYIKYFEDKILFETAAKATVIELSVPEINPSVRPSTLQNKAIKLISYAKIRDRAIPFYDQFQILKVI